MPGTELPRAVFPCRRCGACCSHVDRSPQTQHLDRGDGSCRHLDEATRSCAIYADRPLVRRVEAYYEAKFASHCSWEQFVQINLAACEKLVAEDGCLTAPSDTPRG